MNYKSRPIVCDTCQCKLFQGDGWYHKKGDFYDLCREDHSQLEYVDTLIFEFAHAQHCEKLLDQSFSNAQC